MWAHNSDHKRKCLERFQTVIFIHNIMKQTERHEANRVIGNIGIPLEYLNNHHYLVRNRQLYLKYSKSLSVLLLYTFGMPWASETLNKSIMSSQTVCSGLVSTANCTDICLGEERLMKRHRGGTAILFKDCLNLAIGSICIKLIKSEKSFQLIFFFCTIALV